MEVTRVEERLVSPRRGDDQKGPSHADLEPVGRGPARSTCADGHEREHRGRRAERRRPRRTTRGLGPARRLQRQDGALGSRERTRREPHLLRLRARRADLRRPQDRHPQRLGPRGAAHLRGSPLRGEQLPVAWLHRPGARPALRHHRPGVLAVHAGPHSREPRFARRPRAASSSASRARPVSPTSPIPPAASPS